MPGWAFELHTLSLQSIFGRGAAVNGINGTNKGSRVLANAVGLSESDSEAGQSDEGGADADAHELLAAADDGSSEEEDLDDEQLEQASMQLMCQWSSPGDGGIYQ